MTHRATHLVLLPALLLLVACEGYGELHTVRDERVAEDVQAALDALPRAQVLVVGPGGVPEFVGGDLGDASTRAADDAVDAGLGRSLVDLAPVFRLHARDLELVSVHREAIGQSHIRFRQLLDGLEVVGGDLSVHVDARGVVYAAHGTARGDVDALPYPSLDADTAIELAAGSLADEALDFGFPRLVYVRLLETAETRLAWESIAKGEAPDGLPIVDRVFVDAHSGEVLQRHPQIHTARNRRVHDAGGGYSLPGTRRRTEGSSATGDSSIDAAYDHTGTGYDCIKAMFNRDSYDGNGAALVSTVHYGNRFANAYWNGSQMVYGDGDGSSLGPLSEALDITVHELTHGITERTSDLVYQSEPGALNEAMSDVLAASCEAWADGAVSADTWKLGEDVYTPRIAGDALRYMDDPTADGMSRDWYPERYTGSADNGGVHINSGIPNLAFKLLVTGGSHPRGKSSTSVAALGLDPTAKIFYRALTVYLTSYSDFEDARAATAQAATDLYGASAAAAVHDAWTAVGVPGAPVAPPSGGGGGGSGSSELSSGQAVSGLSGGAGTELRYTVTVPSGAASLMVQTSGGSGDADLYVKRGSAPTTRSYDFRPYLGGNEETVEVANPAADTWHVMVRGYSAFSGLTLVAVVETANTAPPPPPPADDELHNGSTETGLSASKGSELRWTFTVPAGATDLEVRTWGGSGDADLYLRAGAAPTTSSYDYRPYRDGNDEAISVDSPTAGTWHVMVRAYQAFSSLSLSVSWSEGGAPTGPTVLQESEPNDDAANAQAVDATVTVKGTIGDADDTDVFSVTASGAFSIALTVPSGKDYDLYLYDSSGTLVTRSTRGAGQAEDISVSAGSGTSYFVLIHGYGGDFDATALYTLELDG